MLKPRHKSPGAIAATLAMVKCGATMLHAKPAAERALAEGRAIIHLPVVEDRKALADDLEAAGMIVTFSAASHGRHNRKRRPAHLRIGYNVPSALHFPGGVTSPLT